MNAPTKPPARGGKGPAGKRNRLSSVTTAIRLLKAFSEDEAEIGVSALAQRLKVAKSTVHRLAVTLVTEGLLEQNPQTERYRLGVGLFALGTLVRRRMDLSNEARPYLFDLRKLTGETIILGVPSDGEVMHVYDLESPQALAMKSDLGARKPAHCSAVGRAIFAFAPEQAIERLLAGPLQRRTAKTVTDPARLREMLAETRQRGFAIEDEESEPGIRGIAAPVRDSTGAVVGAVGIAGPLQRLSLEALEGYSPALLEAVAAISSRLGYTAAFRERYDLGS
ncbi:MULTISPECIES: IclR family transcriptional regulator [Sinorhizobium]|uniref:IclR family transcriptional regulator n=1 Tax=Sinorhizobium TaxID=28105 RepID=UPI001DE0CE95|nr:MULTISPECIES: IclR family transcriptional regulator [Sinorhizobium]MBP1884679.1 DNA-binding IclR family transcriptional regulator [Sinorhizobium mexicanum]MDK1374611.1 IclR family transcriptional regulator [Sinorhizobium sp. 6-70]MDK1478188.1 IclR family transcriptional regulator [Sinorhizobium sp. 6-117]